MDYGLIGARLGYSYSKIIHEQVCDYTYDLHPLPTEEEARAFFAAKEYRAINVTIPYKKVVMEYCDEIAPAALAIGAVNTVVNKNGKLYGYNTDYAGFSYLCEAHGIAFAGKTVLILGTGGTRNTTYAVARDGGAANIFVASRTPKPEQGEIDYQAALTCGAQIIINTTPAGTYPNTDTCAIDIKAMQGVEAVVDAVYNPFQTELVLRATEMGIPKEKAVTGLEMLVAQAVYAAEHFLSKPFPNAEAEIAKTTAQLKAKLSNIALIGMPSCGKSSLGKALATDLGKTFVDLDEEIEKAAGKPIPQIFAEDGEAAFRAIEHEQIARFAKENRQILSCGGGAVLDDSNMRALRQNGMIVYIDRPLEQLATGGYRPLSTSAEALQKMYAIRAPLYTAAADMVFHNSGLHFAVSRNKLLCEVKLHLQQGCPATAP
ncbi:MAG: shikimate kinase [Faecalibacterium sp.]